MGNRLTEAKNTMKNEIERSLAPLVTLPMWAMDCAADLAMFTFGDRRLEQNRHGEVVGVREYTLHVQCAWRLVGQNGIIVASRDYFYPAGDPNDDPPNFDHDQPGANRRDERMAAFFAECGHEVPVVESIDADRVGSLRIVMSHDVTLEVFPNDSLEGEYWRFFPAYSHARHFVVTGRGIKDHEA